MLSRMLFFVAGFLIILLGWLPISVPLWLLRSGGADLAWSGAKGSAWSGSVSTFEAGGVRISSLRIWIEPKDLFQGRARLAFRSEVPSAGGFLSADPAGLRITRAGAAIALSAIYPEAPPGARVHLLEGAFVLSGDTCLSGNARLEIVVSQDTEPLPGTVSCEAGGVRTLLYLPSGGELAFNVFPRQAFIVPPEFAQALAGNGAMR